MEGGRGRIGKGGGKEGRNGGWRGEGRGARHGLRPPPARQALDPPLCTLYFLLLAGCVTFSAA